MTKSSGAVPGWRSRPRSSMPRQSAAQHAKPLTLAVALHFSHQLHSKSIQAFSSRPEASCTLIPPKRAAKAC